MTEAQILEFLWTVVGALGGVVVVVAAVTHFIARRSVEYFFEKRLAAHRKQLESELNEQRDRLSREATHEVEKVRAIAAVALKEHEIMLSRLQDRRANVIEELYEKLVDTEHCIRRYAVLASAEEGGIDGVRGAISELLKHFDRKNLWLPADCCAKVETFMVKLRVAFTSMAMFKGQPPLNPQEAAAFSAAWSEEWSRMEEDLPSARAALAEELRCLLDPRLGPLTSAN